jgi:hypothetical protein
VKQTEMSMEKILAIRSKLQLVYAAAVAKKIQSTDCSAADVSEGTLAEYPDTMVTGTTDDRNRTPSLADTKAKGLENYDDSSEITDLERKLEETEGEFDFSAVPPLMTSALKAGLLHVCSPEEISRGTMCRWEPVGAVLTEMTLFLHPLNDEQKADITACSGAIDIDVCKVVLGIPPVQSFPLSQTQGSLLLHPVFSDAFEIVVAGTKVYYISI